jgi:ATP-dependent DNA ligase
LNLEGIVAKHKAAPYVTEREHSTWFKILNREYPQKEGKKDEKSYLNATGTASRFPDGHTFTVACDEMT